jgi:hypothetical protein
MATFVMRKGRLVRKERAAPPSGAFVISDEMAPTRHMADGKHYTSKAKFRQATRRAGCIEVGNETTTLLKPRRTPAFDRETRRAEVRQMLRRQLRGETMRSQD